MTVNLTYEDMQELRNQAFAKGKSKATRQKAFEVLKDAFMKAEIAKLNGSTVLTAMQIEN